MKKLSFADLGLSEDILKAVKKKGFTAPSSIQAGVIPLLLKGEKDIIGQAQTGTGKTAAFALPLLERLDASLKQTQAIVLVPTRELAIQVAKEIESFSVPHSPTVAVVYGGNHMRQEVITLRSRPHIVVGTPGRMQHHIHSGYLKLESVRYFVLDEADEMLNFGFREEIEEILKSTPPERRVLLFSATMPRSIMNIVHHYMKDYDTVKAAAEEGMNENIAQKYYCIQAKHKFEALYRIIESEETFYAIVFCRTKSDTDSVARQIVARHLRAEAIHGDIDQSERERILGRFREGHTNILIATDVAARGIDINDLSFVINYSLPESYESYTHRIGRTGRAGKSGTAITFVTRSEVGRLRFFERSLNIKIEKGTLPSPADLIARKKQHLIERLEHIINNESIDYLSPLAEQLLEECDSSKLLAALLHDAYMGDFDPRNYDAIPDDSPQFESRGMGGGRGQWRGGNSAYAERRVRGRGRR